MTKEKFTVSLKISQEDINQAFENRKKCSYNIGAECPVALALTRVLTKYPEDKKFLVNSTTAKIMTRTERWLGYEPIYSAKLSKKLIKFIEDFDLRQKAKPTNTFRLTFYKAE